MIILGSIIIASYTDYIKNDNTQNTIFVFVIQVYEEQLAVSAMFRDP